MPTNLNLKKRMYLPVIDDIMTCICKEGPKTVIKTVNFCVSGVN